MQFIRNHLSTKIALILFIFALVAIFFLLSAATSGPAAAHTTPHNHLYIEIALKT